MVNISNRGISYMSWKMRTDVFVLFVCDVSQKRAID
jgi:hypothetical protein